MSKERWIEIEDTINLIDEHIEIRNCSAKYICNKLNEQEHRIAELEEQLKNAIVPKFKVGQDIFVYDCSCQLRTGKIFEIQTNQMEVRREPLIEYMVDFYGAYSDDDQESDYFEEKYLFATKEEAQSKLKELRGK